MSAAELPVWVPLDVIRMTYARSCRDDEVMVLTHTRADARRWWIACERRSALGQHVRDLVGELPQWPVRRALAIEPSGRFYVFDVLAAGKRCRSFTRGWLR
jgi:hypothetical protein